MPQQACPLCGSPAQYRSIAPPEGKHFDCPTCIAFFIDAASESKLESFVEVTRTERRSMLSKKAAAAAPEKLLVIRAPRPEEVAHEGPGMARTNMVIEVVSRG